MYRIGDEELEALQKLFLSKKFFRYQGKNVVTNTLEFEKEFSDYIGVQKSLMVTSGTNALILALRCADVGSGDEVIVPSYTFIATIAAVRAVGARAVVVNVTN